jgi:molybdopterin/thiamine biosynthesis adenylyltransferase/rhodanese-related sulfurtransferase
MKEFNAEELKRYSRHLVLEEFGIRGQRALKQAKVLVVGCGGLGCPALLYLTAAGVGTLGVADNDQVDLSNLQRQILFTVEDIGKSKADTATRRLKALNPHVEFRAYHDRISSSNALDILKEYDIIIDATDNFPTRYLINDACVLLGKPFVYGSILKFEGQVAVFNLMDKDGKFSANYRDLFPVPPDPESAPNCEQAGVLGVLPGLVGAMQANETIKILSATGSPLANKLLIVDAFTMEQTIIKIADVNTRKSITSLIDYDFFCGISQDKNKSLPQDVTKTSMKEITVEELKELKESGADFQLIDVREPHEVDICTLGGELIPMGELPQQVSKISRDKKVVIYCRSGARSGRMVQWLEQNHQFTNLYNLQGGILAWADEIDPDMATY